MNMTKIQTLEKDAGFPAYVAEPKGTPRGAIVVIQEIFGVNAGIRQKADKLAADGYLAVAPDLFWRLNSDTNLDPDVEAEFKQALDLMGQFDQAQGVKDIEATIRWARKHVVGAKEGGGKVGCVGYCLGGRLAYMAAARTDVDASVGYYAVGVDGLLGESHAIAHPLMLHIAGNDGFVPAGAQAAMHAGLDSHAKVTLHDYPGLDHGFATEMGQRRDDAGATLADSRTSAFFKDNIG